MADSDTDSISSASGLDDERKQSESPDTKTLPVLAFSSILLKKKIMK